MDIVTLRVLAVVGLATAQTPAGCNNLVLNGDFEEANPGYAWGALEAGWPGNGGARGYVLTCSQCCFLCANECKNDARPHQTCRHGGLFAHRLCFPVTRDLCV